MNDINFNIGSVNPSGIADVVFYIPKHYILGWPPFTVDVLAALMDDGYVKYGDSVNDSFTLKTGCVWHRLYNTQGKGKISWEYAGERDCRVPVNKAEFSFPRITDEVRAFAKFSSNGDFVFIAKQNKQYYVIGNQNYRATVTPSGDSGDSAGSAKGMTISLECCDTTPLPVYEGDLLLEDGILDCNTNTFKTYEDIMNTNKIVNYSDRIVDNVLQFEAEGLEGRIHIEGTGPILLEVSVDRENYVTVEHEIEFENGIAIAPISLFIGDQVRLSATTLTKVVLNYNKIKTN